MKFLHVFFFLFFGRLLLATPMLPISNLQADGTILNGLGFALVVPSQRALNFTLTTYQKLNPASWYTISFPSTMTYANVSIPASNFNCNINFNHNGGGNYQGTFGVRSNGDDIQANFIAKSTDADIAQFQNDLKTMCGGGRSGENIVS